MDEESCGRINRRYLLGVNDEPKQLLEPISGYAHEPLVSLEDACEPLKDIVPRLEAHVWVAKQNSKNPTDGLTQDESAAIRLYTMEWDGAENEPCSSLYCHLNRTLKIIDRTKLRPWFRYLKLFLTALAKLPPIPRQTVWRGVRNNQTDDYLPGSELTWWAFSSCTTSLKVLESDLYLGHAGVRTLFSIETFNGRTIRAHSHFQVEDEVLILPGTYFEVKSQLNPAPDLFIIHLRQKRPPHDLLEPPFEGAELIPPAEPRWNPQHSFEIASDKVTPVSRPWYKSHKLHFGFGIALAVITLVIVLASVLGSRAHGASAPPLSTDPETPTTRVLAPVPIPKPVSVATAFYAFDGNTLDLYSNHDGEVIGGAVTYVPGYIPYGRAIAFKRSTAARIRVASGFNVTSTTSFTIEGFFLLKTVQMNAILVQLNSHITMNLTDGLLSMAMGSSMSAASLLVLSTDQWHHLSFVYNADEHKARTYIDGQIQATRTLKVWNMPDNDNRSEVIIGAGFYGYIDQLAISSTAKSSAAILWDATTYAYYSFNDPSSQSKDDGPNGLNATGFNLLSTPGWFKNATNFNQTGSNLQANGFTALGTPRSAFTIALWVRAEMQAGVFLTVANAHTCLLVLGLQNEDDRLIAFFPNATASGKGVNILGDQMPKVWVHVAVTWSVENNAHLYSSGFSKGIGKEATTLNNALPESRELPMTITLGHYNGSANCQGIEGVDTSKPFIGTLDELLIFGREFNMKEVNDVVFSYPAR